MYLEYLFAVLLVHIHNGRVDGCMQYLPRTFIGYFDTGYLFTYSPLFLAQNVLEVHNRIGGMRDLTYFGAIFGIVAYCCSFSYNFSGQTVRTIRYSGCELKIGVGSGNFSLERERDFGVSEVRIRESRRGSGGKRDYHFFYVLNFTKISGIGIFT